MLSADVLRLAAIEVLRPTKAVIGEESFPTLAGGKVLDSRALAVRDFHEIGNATPVPVVCVYSAEVDAKNRGDDLSGTDFDVETRLEFVVEIAAIQQEDNENFVDAVPGSDPEARLTLGALTAQIRFALLHSDEGHLFRRFCRYVSKIEEEPFAVPQFGIRYQRITMRFSCGSGDDCFDFATGKPVDLQTLHDLLPSESYAKTKASELIAAFIAPNHTLLTTPDVAQDGATNIKERSDDAP